MLIGSPSALDVFVTENLYNTNYNDEDLYNFDGYALMIEATIADEMPVGMCLENSCWSFETIFSDQYMHFTSFTLALEC